MKYTQTGVQDTFKSLVFFPNGMGALILKTGESYDVVPATGNQDDYDLLENLAKTTDKGGLDKVLDEIRLAQVD